MKVVADINGYTPVVLNIRKKSIFKINPSKNIPVAAIIIAHKFFVKIVHFLAQFVSAVEVFSSNLTLGYEHPRKKVK